MTNLKFEKVWNVVNPAPETWTWLNLTKAAAARWTELTKMMSNFSLLDLRLKCWLRAMFAMRLLSALRFKQNCAFFELQKLDVLMAIQGLSFTKWKWLKFCWAYSRIKKFPQRARGVLKMFVCLSARCSTYMSVHLYTQENVETFDPLVGFVQNLTSLSNSKQMIFWRVILSNLSSPKINSST